jgi:SAM-dependent methyltransferase
MIPKKVRLVLVSFLGLFLELSLIRWLPAHVFSIAFFSNIVLIASFLGLGLGLLISRYKWDFFKFFPVILAGTIFLVLFLRNIQVNFLADTQTWIWSYYSGNRLHSLSFLKISITQFISLIFVLTAIIFIPIGQKIGKLMEGFNPLFAYSMNILGSLLGVVGFGIIAIFHSPAYIWFLVAGLIVILVSYREPNFLRDLFLMLAIVISIAFVEKDILWSPYYAINVEESDDKSLSVFVNQLFHQKSVNFESEPHLYNKYMFPYRWFRPKRVLIIGSGTGNDVWIARKAGAEYIDAVEIDPVIIKLEHPQQPYDSDRVRVFVDDARSFMHRASEKYDMVVYGTLDSHATLSTTSSIRLDNYVYTKEALEEAGQLLAPKGVIVLLFSTPRDWMTTRLLETVGSVFGPENTRYVVADNQLFNLIIIAGPGLRQAFLANPNLSNILLPSPASSCKPIPTDDWPYLYLSDRGIPPLYLFTLTAIICISLLAIFGLSPLRTGKIDPSFFFLGCGFLLLETKSVTTFSLLFGSTWIVNAVVFSSILAIALLANWLVMAKQLQNPRPFFAGLMLSLFFLYFFPLTSLLTFGLSAKIFGAWLLIALPIFFSSFVFAILIKRTKDIGISLGSNLLGAVTGGFFEYSSMIWGLNAL